MKVTRVISEHTAWDLGGQDWTSPTRHTFVRIKGGRALYDAVWADANRGDRVRISRIGPTRSGDVRAIIRWIDADLKLEVVEVQEQ